MLAFSVLLAFSVSVSSWFGSCISAITQLQSQLQVGGVEFPWVSATVLAPLIISACIFPAFLYVESLHPEPLVPLRLFRQRNFIFIIIFTLCLGAGFYTLTIFLPQRMEVVNLLSAITSGVRMLPQLVLIGTLSPFAGAAVVLTKSYRPLMWFASALGPIGAGLLSILKADTNFSQQYGFEVIVGISVGVTITVSTMIVQFSTDRPDLASATGFQTFARQLGALIAIAISTAVLNSRVDSKLELAGISEELRSAITASPATVLSSGQLDDSTKLYVQEAYSDGFSKVFVEAAAWLAVGALATWGLIHILPKEIEERGRKPKAEVVAGTDLELGVQPEAARVDLEKGPIEGEGGPDTSRLSSGRDSGYSTRKVLPVEGGVAPETAATESSRTL